MSQQFLTDINCDLGEGYADEEIIPYISSANIATGFHAGSPPEMSFCIDLCMQHGVKIGAHPSYWDRENFGRKVVNIHKDELFNILIYQIGALYQMCLSKGTTLHHVKPHGALYHASVKDKETARTIAQAVKSVDKNLILYGMSGSLSLEAAKEEGLKVCAEAFADRRYLTSGWLVPRNQPNSTFKNYEESLNQAVCIAHQKPIETAEETFITIQADTICIHSDYHHSVELAQKIYEKISSPA